MTSKPHIKEYNEESLNLRYDILVQVIESLGVWESLSSFHTFRDKVKPTSAQEWIRQKHFNKCQRGANASNMVDCSGNKRNCHGMIANTHHTFNPEQFAIEQQKHRSHILLKHLHRDDNNILGGALVRIPSMQLDNPEDNDDITCNTSSGNNHTGSLLPLQDVGSSHSDEKIMCESKTSDHDSILPPKPKMQASLLHILEHASPPSTSSSDLPHNDLGTTFVVSKSPDFLRQVEPSVSKQLQESASVNLGRLLSFTRTSVPHAPITLLHSLSSSFSSLLQSHIKSWTILLLRQSLNSGDETCRSRLLKLLAVQDDFAIKTMVTEFIIVEEQQIDGKLKLSEEGFKRRESRLEKIKEEGRESGSILHMDYCDLILPFVLKVAMDISFYGEEVTVHFHIPGSAGGTSNLTIIIVTLCTFYFASITYNATPCPISIAMFHENSEKITYLECKVDTEALVKSMVEQMRAIVFQAVSRVTAVSDQMAESSRIIIPHQTANVGKSFTKLSSFRPVCSTLDAKDTTATFPTQRNRIDEKLSDRNTCALSDLEQNECGGRQDSNSPISHTVSSTEEPCSLLRQPGSFLINKGIFKERSVQWDTHVKPVIPIHQDQKRIRQNGPIISRMVRSSKSFGKPGPAAFEHSRNATFSDFGNVSLSVTKKNTFMSLKSPNQIDCNFFQKNSSSLSSSSSSHEVSGLNVKCGSNPLESLLHSTPSNPQQRSLN